MTTTRREKMTYTGSAISKLRELDIHYPDWSEERRDALTDIAETLARLENEEEVNRYHLVDATSLVLSEVGTVHYCPTCQHYNVVNVSSPGYEMWCNGGECGRQMTPIKFVRRP